MSITGLTTNDQCGTPELGRQHNRRDFQANLLHAVVVRPWDGRDSGPGGITIWLTNIPVEKPWQPFDDDDNRGLIAHCDIKVAKPQWALSHPPQQNERAVRVHVALTLLLLVWATASRLPCAPEATGREAVGWQRWRCQLLEQTREPVLVWAQGDDGILQQAEDSRLVGVKLKDVLTGIGTRQDVLATYRLTRCG